MVTTRSPVATHLRRLTGLAVAVMLAGCSVPFATYTVASSNISAIRAAKRGVELGDFTGLQATVSCRLQNIGPDGERTFAQYIRGAFNDELVIAGPAPQRDRSTLSLRVKDVSVSCGNIWGKWTIEAEVRITNQLPFTVKVSREFDGSVLADVVWKRASLAFVPTVQELIGTIIANPAYKDEFGSNRGSTQRDDIPRESRSSG